MKRLFAVLVALAFLLSGASAQFYIMGQHTIAIDIDSGANAKVTERYYLLFQNDQQLLDFRQTVAQVGVSLDGWKSYDSRIYPRIGREQDIAVSGISFVEEPAGQDFLEINYSLKEPIMETRSETSRVLEYGLKAKFFTQFQEGPLWLIPEGTSIRVALPKGVQIEPPVKPDARVEESTVLWKGYASGNELALNYRQFKEIASFDLSQAISELMKSDLFMGIAIVALVVLGMLFVKRKSISGRIEAYVIEHSDLSNEED